MTAAAAKSAMKQPDEAAFTPPVEKKERENTKFTLEPPLHITRQFMPSKRCVFGPCQQTMKWADLVTAPAVFGMNWVSILYLH